MSKTVYVLGAGFSKCADAPLQGKILDEVFNLTPSFSTEYDKPFETGRSQLKEFLKELFQEDSDKNLSKIDLENLFTILDKALINKENIRDKSFENIEKIRNNLNCCIVYMFNEKLKDIGYFYFKLADAIVKRRTEVNQEDDPVSFITLNWDIILEHSLFKSTNNFNEIAENNASKIGKVPQLCFVDYTCYAYPFEMDDYPYRSIDIKPRGHFNIKIMKLHGSLNWLICSNCGRLFFKLDYKIAIYDLLRRKSCPECHRDALHSLIVTPTLIKDLNNTHLKMVWHNALLDLMEAEKVVFAGYSFPIADFELRYLLKRGISPTAKIEVVLKENDEEIFGRYQQFFGRQFNNNGRITVGTAKYFSNELGFELYPNDCPEYPNIVF